MQLEERNVGIVCVLSVLDARMDARSSVDLKGAVSTILRKGRTKIVLDLSRVKFVDSSGLGAVVGALKLVGTNGDFVIAGINESVATLFRLTRMDKVFRVFTDSEDAMRALHLEGK
jgi:anti-sigma B factor antagonist